MMLYLVLDSLFEACGSYQFLSAHPYEEPAYAVYKLEDF